MAPTINSPEEERIVELQRKLFNVEGHKDLVKQRVAQRTQFPRTLSFNNRETELMNVSHV